MLACTCLSIMRRFRILEWSAEPHYGVGDIMDFKGKGLMAVRSMAGELELSQQDHELLAC